MVSTTDLEMVIRLLLAFVLGAVPGLEREQKDRPAGLRTHMLVSAGSACFTMAGIYGFTGGQHDFTRIAAQVVSGIGFLGAGTIIRDRGNIRGLTTAASIWLVSAIGMLAGTGLFLLAITTTVITFIVLRYISRLEIDKPRSPREGSSEFPDD
jgi:putative Mg2+ transporter-C (MgtC) family protein